MNKIKCFVFAIIQLIRGEKKGKYPKQLADYPVLQKLNILEDKHKNIDKNLLIDLEKIEKRKWSK